MNPIILSNAIIALGGTSFSARDIDTIKYHDGNPNNITRDQIQVKYNELLEEHNKLQYQRDRADIYPEIKEQIDMLWHAIDSGTLDKESDFYTTLKKVKDDNPKP